MQVGTAFQSAKSALRGGVIALATAASMFGPNIVHASDVTPVAVVTPASFTKKECANILAVSSYVIDALHPGGKGLLPQFTLGLATFIAPDNPELARKILTEGTFDQIASSKTPEGIAAKKALIAALKCDNGNGRDTLTMDDEAVVVMIGIERELSPLNISLHGKFRMVDPNKVAAL
jgi:hypothetical protein